MQNKPIADQAPCNCLAIRQAARRITQLYDSYLAPLGLRTSQYSVLAKLSRRGPLSINEIADSMVMDRTTTGRAIKPLERDGLIVVETGEDGRQRLVRLTGSGAELFRKAQAQWRKAQADFESSFGAAPAAQLRSTMRNVVDAIPDLAD